MKKALLACAAFWLIAPAALAATCTTPICKTDGEITVNTGGTINVDGGTLVVDGHTVDENTLAMDDLTATADQINLVAGNPGRGFFQICGDATTVNNNTVYYGPGSTLTANIPGGRSCDITAAGNTTEATADAPVFTNKAFQVLGMTCFNQADQDADITYTLRTAAGATVPSVTCTIADGERDCVADVQTTTAVAAGATVAIAASSTSDIGASKGFNCTVFIAY
jgi:hypothetical protein